MRALAAIWTEIFAVFVDDGVFAGGILIWLALGGALLPRLPSPWPAVILPAGLILILVAGALRRAHRRQD